MLKLKGKYTYELFDKEGNLKDTWESYNTITNQGLQSIIDVGFLSSTQITNWYVGVYTARTGTPANLTTASIGVDITEFTNYSESTRPGYSGTRTNESLSNALSKAAFSITGSGTILGSFLIDSNAKSTTSGNVLFSLDDFPSSRTVGNGDTLNVTYQLTLASA